MKTLTILLTDYLISKSTLQAVFCEKFRCRLFDFGSEFGQQVERKDAFATEINRYYAEGRLLPDFIYEKVITNTIQEYKADRILLYDYPRTQEQFRSLLKVFSFHSYHLEDIWYVKQRSQDTFILDYLTDPAQKPWIEKYGLHPEVVQKWRVESAKRKQQIEGIKEAATGSVPFHTLEADYQIGLTKEYLLAQLQTLL